MSIAHHPFTVLNSLRFNWACATHFVMGVRFSTTCLKRRDKNKNCSNGIVCTLKMFEWYYLSHRTSILGKMLVKLITITFLSDLTQTLFKCNVIIFGCMGSTDTKLFTGVLLVDKSTLKEKWIQGETSQFFVNAFGLVVRIAEEFLFKSICLQPCVPLQTGIANSKFL